ncbi:hypothetical protein GCM10009605_30430 [Nocardiopsis composta]
MVVEASAPAACALTGRRGAVPLEVAMTRHFGSDDTPEVRLDSGNDIVVGPFSAAISAKCGDPRLLRSLHERHDALRRSHRVRDESGPTGTNITVATALLAADRVLSDRLPDPEQRQKLLEQALVEPLAEMTQEATAAALDTADDPFAAMVATARERETSAFGPRFVFAHPVDGDAEFISEVRHCFFHELLTRHGAGHLTSILCAFDANWMDAVVPGRHGFTVDRATTIAAGGASCPFRFRRVATG